MRAYFLVSLLVFTFGAFAYGILFFLWIRGKGKIEGGRAHASEGAITVFSSIWFLVNLLVLMAEMHLFPFWPLLAATLSTMTLLYPPLIMHTYYDYGKEYLPRPRIWQVILAGAYVLSLAGSLGIQAVLLGWDSFPRQFLKPYLGASGQSFHLMVTGFFILAALYCILISSRPHPLLLKIEDRRHRRVTILLFCFMFVLFAIAVFYSTEFLGLLLRSLPLFFVFASTYYTHRFQFYDVFVKRGTFFLLSLVGLTLFFYLVFPRLPFSEDPRISPWLQALWILPVLLVAPWAYVKLEGWLDRVWLDRQFSPPEARHYFYEGIACAANKGQLATLAEKLLANIFQTSVQVSLSPSLAEDPTAFDCGLKVPIQLYPSQEFRGMIRFGHRPNKSPFLSEDLQLIHSLAYGIASTVEHLESRDQKRAQELREQELRLHASRSELKALRAQINPHFLFNALNAIAGLIHKNPDKAEETVEQLAEVFRYTLKRSEKEWVRLSEEVDFLQAYLDVEKARMGERLHIELKVQAETQECRIPCMILQTLAENAIKHGVSRLRENGLLKISSWIQGEMLHLEVVNNGPANPRLEDPLAIPVSSTGSGYGLKNISERLRGYFQDRARMEFHHDPNSSLTTVSLQLPANLEMEGFQV